MDAPLNTYESTAAESAQQAISQESHTVPEPSDSTAGVDFSALAGILSLLGSGSDDAPHDTDESRTASGDDAVRLLRHVH